MLNHLVVRAVDEGRRWHNITDEEHPTVIPMDLPTSLKTPRGPMTRARARAIENEVNSLLIELPFDPLETWLLPQTEMLCVLRYQGSNQGEVTMQDRHQEHEEDLPSPERPVQPPMYRPTTARAVQPLDYR